MRAYAGVDPGASGAVAVWVPEVRNLTIRDLPSVEVKRGKSNVNEISSLELHAMLEELFNSVNACGQFVALCLLEQPGVRPGQAVNRVATTFSNWGRVEAMLIAQTIPVEIIAPQVWKRDMKLISPKDATDAQIKAASRHRASQLLPQFAANWDRSKDHNRAEAVLIALYAERLDLQRKAVKS